MNALVSKLLALSPNDLVISPSITVLSQLNQIADAHMRLGPVPSALICAKILDAATETANQLHPVHLKTLNALSHTLPRSVSELSTPLAIKSFSSFALAGHPAARQILSALQDKWFENWNPASVAKGSRRPKLKQAVFGIYSLEDHNGTHAKMKFSGNLRALSTNDLSEFLRGIDSLRNRGVHVHDLKHIISACENEMFRRSAISSEPKENSFISPALDA